MTPIWRYLTHPAGMTVQQLADSTKLSIVRVRADLVELEREGKAFRVRGSVGTPHLWWRAEKRPIGRLDALLSMALAAALHTSKDTLREVLAGIGNRSKSKQVQKAIVLCATANDPHTVTWSALEDIDPAALTN